MTIAVIRFRATVVALAALFSIAAYLPAKGSPHDLRAAFNAHCTKCHGRDGKVRGKVNLLALKSDADLLARPKLLEDLVSVLKEQEMPPKGEPHLPEENSKQMLTAPGASLKFRSK